MALEHVLESSHWVNICSNRTISDWVAALLLYESPVWTDSLFERQGLVESFDKIFK